MTSIIRPLRLFNTLTRSVDDFRPLHDLEVGMYSCGPTVYAPQHIGNMRAYVFCDTLKRVLRHKGWRVRHVMPITDVGHLTSDADSGEDKVELAARRQSVDANVIADRYTRQFRTDLAKLRVIDPDVWAKASGHVPQMIEFVTKLEHDGWCYRLPSGLYFDTSRDPSYGRLARLDLGGQIEGARVEPVEGKRNPSDFALWRTSGPTQRYHREWDSPWGRGIPGWHLECSVMSILYLGNHFDIHTGGVDHIPVHHTNEIAQSEAYLGDGQRWVRWWLHGQFINLKGAKISKSTGAVVTLDDLVQRGYHPLVYRYLLLQAHYRSQIEFSWEAMDAARAGFRRLLDRYGAARSAGRTATDDLNTDSRSRVYLDRFAESICDDLNTAVALAAVIAASKDEAIADVQLNALAAVFEQVLGIGLADLTPADLDATGHRLTVNRHVVEELVSQRSGARRGGNFAQADAIRKQLAALGVTVQDHPDGNSTWHPTRHPTP